jgi:hypothetical protein
MRRYLTFTFRVNPDELKMIASLSRYHHRSKSDVIRMLLREAINNMSITTQVEVDNLERRRNERPSTKS